MYYFQRNPVILWHNEQNIEFNYSINFGLNHQNNDIFWDEHTFWKYELKCSVQCIFERIFKNHVKYCVFPQWKFAYSTYIEMICSQNRLSHFPFINQPKYCTS